MIKQMDFNKEISIEEFIRAILAFPIYLQLNFVKDSKRLTKSVI